MTSIENLTPGSVFLYKFEPYIKTDDKELNAVNLKTGAVEFLPDYLEVIQVFRTPFQQSKEIYL